MKSYKLFILIFLIISPSLVFAQRELLDQVIAVVNDEPITQSELDTLLKPVYEQFRTQYHGEELILKMNEARQKLLNQLIEDRLVYQEAVRLGVKIDEAEIDKTVEEFKTRFPDEKTMQEVMELQGFTFNDLRERFRRQAMIRNLHSQEVRSRIVVSPNEIEEYYEKNADKFSHQNRVKVRSITIKKSFEAREKGLVDEEALKKMKEIKQNIEEGRDFSAFAKEFSEDTSASKGGLSDWIPEGTMIPAINDVIFSQKVGELSDVIETPMGYHLFRVEEKEAGYRRSLDDVRDQIRNEIYAKKSDERFYDWMQELKRNAYISVR